MILIYREKRFLHDAVQELTIKQSRHFDGI